MVDVEDLREIFKRSRELEEWAKAAYATEEAIMEISKHIKSYEHKRGEAKDPRYKAEFDLEISKLEKYRAVQDLKKAKTLSEMKEIIRKIVKKFGEY